MAAESSSSPPPLSAPLLACQSSLPGGKGIHKYLKKNICRVHVWSPDTLVTFPAASGGSPRAAFLAFTGLSSRQVRSQLERWEEFVSRYVVYAEVAISGMTFFIHGYSTAPTAAEASNKDYFQPLSDADLILSHGALGLSPALYDLSEADLAETIDINGRPFGRIDPRRILGYYKKKTKKPTSKKSAATANDDDDDNDAASSSSVDDGNDAPKKKKKTTRKPNGSNASVAAPRKSEKAMREAVAATSIRLLPTLRSRTNPNVRRSLPPLMLTPGDQSHVFSLMDMTSDQLPILTVAQKSQATFFPIGFRADVKGILEWTITLVYALPNHFHDHPPLPPTLPALPLVHALLISIDPSSHLKTSHFNFAAANRHLSQPDMLAEWEKKCSGDEANLSMTLAKEYASQLNLLIELAKSSLMLTAKPLASFVASIAKLYSIDRVENNDAVAGDSAIPTCALTGRSIVPGEAFYVLRGQSRTSPASILMATVSSIVMTDADLRINGVVPAHHHHPHHRQKQHPSSVAALTDAGDGAIDEPDADHSPLLPDYEEEEENPSMLATSPTPTAAAAVPRTKTPEQLAREKQRRQELKQKRLENKANGVVSDDTTTTTTTTKKKATAAAKRPHAEMSGDDPTAVPQPKGPPLKKQRPLDDAAPGKSKSSFPVLPFKGIAVLGSSSSVIVQGRPLLGALVSLAKTETLVPAYVDVFNTFFALVDDEARLQWARGNRPGFKVITDLVRLFFEPAANDETNTALLPAYDDDGLDDILGDVAPPPPPSPDVSAFLMPKFIAAAGWLLTICSKIKDSVPPSTLLEPDTSTIADPARLKAKLEASSYPNTLVASLAAFSLIFNIEAI